MNRLEIPGKVNQLVVDGKRLSEAIRIVALDYDVSEDCIRSWVNSYPGWCPDCHHTYGDPYGFGKALGLTENQIADYDAKKRYQLS